MQSPVLPPDRRQSAPRGDSAARRLGCAARPSGELIICDQRFAIDWPVVNWRDDPTYDATRKDHTPTDPFPGQENALWRYSYRREMQRGMQLSRLQQVIQQLVIHYDGMLSSRGCFHVLQDERGLSAHFLIDNDGTIYQTLDLGLLAFHAKGANSVSIGVEICNRGAVRTDQPNIYQEHGLRRDRVMAQVHGHRFEMWDFTECQYQAMIALGRALARLFPNLPQVFPAQNRELVRGRIANVEGFAGYLGHFHISDNKPDPGCFDFARLVRGIKAHPVWFVRLPEFGGGAAETPTLPDDPAQVQAQAAALIANNEQQAMGGFYPVGPYMTSRLWHGGVHVDLPQGEPVRVPLAGTVVAAKFAPPTSVGSVNFVLTRHEVELRGKPRQFYMLFFHLLAAAAPQVPWLQDAASRKYYAELQSGQVVFPHTLVSAGEVIGLVGAAGPAPTQWESQVHVQVLATEEITAGLLPQYFAVLDAGESGLFCDRPEILNLVDREPAGGDGLLTTPELRNFFRQSPERHRLRKLALRFQSEFGNADDYLVQLQRSRDFANLSRSKQRNLFKSQIEPTLWLSEAVARELGLPVDFKLWHYHPVEFLVWLDEQLRSSVLRESTALAGSGPLDADPHAGSNDFMAAEDRPVAATGHTWTLDEFVHGYEDQE